MPRQASLALTILRDDGPAALARRLWAKLRGRGDSGRRPSRPARLETEVAPLALRRPTASPRVSIVIPVYGQPLLTFTCLKSVARNTRARRATR
ncbi:hypothetical protein [Methanothrix soehngenii]|uniref:hypothetical protein n=1 Tax=Methanothrix soehngenii TaxID=2223 RepID=UPI00300C4723